MTEQQQSETFQFEAETKQILELMTHSIYSDPDVFLRELVSNSCDALDRLRFESISNKDLLASDTPLHIYLDVDEKARTLSISDNGIGMSRDEVIENIGTIARSGTKAFMTHLQQMKDKAADSPELIGQFGVGFYASFMVADTVQLHTRKAGTDVGLLWSSTGDGTYSIEEKPRDTAGTTVILHLKEQVKNEGDAGLSKDYLQESVLRSIVTRYSDFVSYPIEMEVEHHEPERDADGKVVEDGKTTVIRKVETLNSMKAIWLRSQSDVTKEEYTEFYHHISRDWRDYWRVITLSAEGTYEYKSLLFIPENAPLQLYSREFRRGLKLYVKRVFILDECKDLLPEYLRFVCGVVDAEDLSLNISREMLQQDHLIKQIRKRLTKKVIDQLKQVKAKDLEDYMKFWREFGQVLKEGIYQEPDYREQLLELVMCRSTKTSEAELISLADYIKRMPESQEKIFYMTGTSHQSIENSPHLEAFKKKDCEVLLFSDPVDEVWLQYGAEFDGKSFQSIGQGNAEVGSETEREQEKQDLEEKTKQFDSLLQLLQEQLKDEVKEVRLSKRLTSSVACMVVDDGDLTPQLQRMMEAMGQALPKSKRILEVNADHPIMQKLQTQFDSDGADSVSPNMASLLVGQAILAEGGELDDPGQFSRLVSDVMLASMN